VRVGFGWRMNGSISVAGHAGGGPGGSASLVMRPDGRRVYVAMTSRLVAIEPVNGRVIHAVNEDTERTE
jgi:hypothetical protein